MKNYKKIYYVLAVLMCANINNMIIAARTIDERITRTQEKIREIDNIKNSNYYKDVVRKNDKNDKGIINGNLGQQRNALAYYKNELDSYHKSLLQLQGLNNEWNAFENTHPKDQDRMQALKNQIEITLQNVAKVKAEIKASKEAKDFMKILKTEAEQYEEKISQQAVKQYYVPKQQDENAQKEKADVAVQPIKQFPVEEAQDRDIKKDIENEKKINELLENWRVVSNALFHLHPFHKSDHETTKKIVQDL